MFIAKTKTEAGCKGIRSTYYGNPEAAFLGSGRIDRGPFEKRGDAKIMERRSVFPERIERWASIS
jgi:hypothetical protein